jgi:DNA-binding protein HU-beta
MNKTQLVDALAARVGDRKTAATAVDGLLDTIVETVRGGQSVSVTGFGVFEPRARAARVARNPRTGETVQVAATTVPAFRPGAGFRAAVGAAAAPAPRAAPTRRRATAAAPAEPAVAAPVRKAAKSKASFAAPETEPTAAPKAAPKPKPAKAVAAAKPAKPAKAVAEKPKKAKSKK